jgi:mono/diheme cytochrome c family protein
MTDERTGRELTPRPDEPSAVVPAREGAPAAPRPPGEERFRAGEQAHTVGLDEQRSAQIVRQSSNARFAAFLGTLILVLFIPLYWIYDIGIPPLDVSGRMTAEEQQQYVTDVSRGYALFLANCARCHGDQGQGGIGPPLNDQGKLYNALTADGLPGTGHLNPDYLRSVLSEGGRYVCGDPASVMPAWLQPKGPLNYREVEEIITFMLASSDTAFEYQPAHAEIGATLPPPVRIEGWRDPNYEPPPDATPVPACWRAPAEGPSGTPAPVTSPGTADNPRVVALEGTEQLAWVDPETGQSLTSMSFVDGETVEFHVTNGSAVVPHNFHIGPQAELSTAPMETDLPGVEPFTSDDGEQIFRYTFDDVPEQPQWACTVAGHYATMHGDLIPVQAANP